ncbi:terpene synthase family protein [Streptomyces sp. NPDC029003]|uniref:terpene synthase family protein n=1 Tax=Streptomyces sp. NPDC029003 TaxID=3155125 RepID=UPI0033DC32DD
MPERESDAPPSSLGRVVLWARRWRLVAGPKEEQRLAAMGLERFAALILAGAGEEDVALTAQWAAFICLVDDEFDRGALARPEQVRAMADGLVRVLEGEQPAAGVPAEAALADLWTRTAHRGPAQWRARFVADYTDFARASREEADVRRAGTLLPLDGYLALRRRTITLLPMADVLECTAHAPMPGNPALWPALAALRLAAADVAGWSNDLASAAADRHQGHDNLIAVLERERGCSAQAAYEQAVSMRDTRLREFHLLAAGLCGEGGAVPAGEREHVKRYVAALCSFLDATLHWLGDTGRFEARWLPTGENSLAGGREG